MVSLDFQQKCIDGDLEEVKSIVNRYALHALIIYQGAYRACQYDHLHIVQYLIEKVTMPNGKNEDFFIRDCITYTKNLEILKYFIKSKAITIIINNSINPPCLFVIIFSIYSLFYHKL